MKDGILALNGLSTDVLIDLSFKSKLNISLKKDLHYFNRSELLNELFYMTEWYDLNTLLADISIDYRIKSHESIVRKYEKYYPSGQARKTFNDILGFRAFCDNYDELFILDSKFFRIANMSKGKANDDGYRGVHLYFQIDNSYYPIEIQYNTLYDRQLNNWLHEYVYKRGYPNEIGQILRTYYETGKIRNEAEFTEVLKNVLSDS